MKLRVKQIGLTLCLIASLLVGSASACACGHHQDAQKLKTEPISCHRASHESTKAETADNGQPLLGENCTCSFATVDAAIVTKSETKRSKAGRSAAAENGQVVEIETTPGEIASAEPRAFSTLYFYSAYFPRSGPSRAPPRL